MKTSGYLRQSRLLDVARGQRVLQGTARTERRSGFRALLALNGLVFPRLFATDNTNPAQRSHAPLPRLEELSAGYLLATSLQALDVGVEIWDTQDQLVYYNEKVNALWPYFHTPAHIGQTYEALTRANFRKQMYPAAVGCEEAWLAEQLAQRIHQHEPQLMEMAGGQWVTCTRTRTPDGFLIVIRTDVTALVRKGRDLEASNSLLIHQSTTDALTGLPNRRRFDDVLSTEWQRAGRNGASLSMLMVDIDHFKRYNDHFGHLSGDDCLRQVAHVLHSCVRRAGELVARYGGEEFVLLLPGSDMAHACEVAQQCLDQMAAVALPHPCSPTRGQITLSIGVACIEPEPDMDPSTILNAADAAMYRAKSNGRAHVQVANRADWEIGHDTPRTHPAPLS